MRAIDADRLLTDRMKSKYYHLPNGDIAIPIIDIEHAPTIEPRCEVCEAFNKTRLLIPQPERKKGKWNWVGFNIECSECGAMPFFDSTEGLYNFCPNCGAEMEGQDDSI